MTAIVDKTLDFLNTEQQKLQAKRDNSVKEIDKHNLLIKSLDRQLEEAKLLIEILTVNPNPETETTPVRVDSGDTGYIFPRKDGRGLGRATMKIENRKQILRVISEHGSVTVEFAAQETGLARPTVQKHMQEMVIQKRIAKIVTVRTSSGGRAPFLYKLIPQAEFNDHKLDLDSRLVIE